MRVNGSGDNDDDKPAPVDPCINGHKGPFLDDRAGNRKCRAYGSWTMGG